MIDIHTHIIPFVDDGCASMEEAIKLIIEEEKQGVKEIILTPHFHRGMFEVSIKKIISNFDLLKKEVKKHNIDIELHLGHEIYISKVESINKYLDNELIIPINNEYLLLEFTYKTDKKIDISEVCYNVSLKGFKAIIAHVERYPYISLDDIIEMKKEKALIQINASSIVGRYGLRIKKKVLKYIKNDLIDFIASDIHYTRKNDLLKAYNIVTKKFGIDVSNKLFNDNALVLINKKDRDNY